MPSTPKSQAHRDAIARRRRDPTPIDALEGGPPADARGVWPLPADALSPHDPLRVLRAFVIQIGDPSYRFAGPEALRATRTAKGPATLWFHDRGDRLEARAWGPGAELALAQVPALTGLEDRTADDFRPTDEPVRSWLKRARTHRIGGGGPIAEILLPTIVAQKVVGKEARESWRRLVWHFSDPAPGPGRLRLPPRPEDVAAEPYETFHLFGIEKRRADALSRAAALCPRVERLVAELPADSEPATRRAAVSEPILSTRGLGPWTEAHVALFAFGDPDAVLVGDYHLPSLVTNTLADEPKGTDERMLELLEPWRGHRARVVRLLSQHGRGPRTARATARVSAHRTALSRQTRGRSQGWPQWIAARNSSSSVLVTSAASCWIQCPDPGTITLL